MADMEQLLQKITLVSMQTQIINLLAQKITKVPHSFGLDELIYLEINWLTSTGNGLGIFIDRDEWSNFLVSNFENLWVFLGTLRSRCTFVGV